VTAYVAGSGDAGRFGKRVAVKEAAAPNIPVLIALVFAQLIFVCMVYGPIAAYLVEPSRESPVHFAIPAVSHRQRRVWRLLPVIGLSLCAGTGNIYAGLLYPMIVRLSRFVVGSIALKETRHVKIWDEMVHKRPASG